MACTGPSCVVKVPVSYEYICVPTMSLGIRSGVHWIREKVPDIAEAIVVAAVVLAKPGTDSSNTCPLASRDVTRAVYSASCPTTRPLKVPWILSSKSALRAKSAALMSPDAISFIAMPSRLVNWAPAHSNLAHAHSTIAATADRDGALGGRLRSRSPPREILSDLTSS